jgi:hypothetical protein
MIINDQYVETYESKTDLIDLINRLGMIKDEISHLQEEAKKVELILIEAKKATLSKEVADELNKLTLKEG